MPKNSYSSYVDPTRDRAICGSAARPHDRWWYCLYILDPKPSSTSLAARPASVPLHRPENIATMAVLPLATTLTPNLQYATAVSGLITIVFGLRAHIVPLVHFNGLGVDPETAREGIIIRAGAHPIGVRTVAMGALLLLGAYRGDAEITGWTMAGMTAVMYVDGAATKAAVLKQAEEASRREGAKGTVQGQGGWLGAEWLHWGSVPVFAGLTLACLRQAYVL